MKSIYDKIVEIRNSKKKAVLCTVISAKGSTPRKAASKMIVAEDKTIYGTIGGGILEFNIIDKAIELINSSTPKLISLNLLTDLGMACGGSVDIFIEPISQKFKLFVFGAGHIGRALVNHLTDIDFDISVIDDRENIFQNWESLNFSKFVMPFNKFITEHQADNNTFIVIVTNNHVSDKEILKYYIKQDYAYLGVIGSKRKTEEIKNLFISEHLATKEEFDRIDMPIGLDIKAEGPGEIAISIAGKLILEKNKLI